MKPWQLRHLRHFRAFVRAGLQSYPNSPDKLLNSDLYKAWWFYSVELLPGTVKQGDFPETMPLPARILLRNCDLRGADCLDIGSMEGLLPVLMCRQGARSVLATDFNFHCYNKLTAVMKYYNVNFRFQQIGLLYDLASKIRGGFDLINLSGVLYHVFSPMHVLAGIRPLLKKDGLLIVTTNVINHGGHHMEFNRAGALQTEANTFWYPTIPLYDYLLRYFQLLPIDHLYFRYPSSDKVRYAKEHESGYLAVVCRAVGERESSAGDNWMSESVNKSWEYLSCDQARINLQPRSSIGYRSDNGRIDLYDRVRTSPCLEKAQAAHDTHLLKLADAI
jgi:SAM-dependent methyltransferase